VVTESQAASLNPILTEITVNFEAANLFRLPARLCVFFVTGYINPWNRNFGLEIDKPARKAINDDSVNHEALLTYRDSDRPAALLTYCATNIRTPTGPKHSLPIETPTGPKTRAGPLSGTRAGTRAGTGPEAG